MASPDFEPQADRSQLLSRLTERQLRGEDPTMLPIGIDEPYGYKPGRVMNPNGLGSDSSRGSQIPGSNEGGNNFGPPNTTLGASGSDEENDGMINQKAPKNLFDTISEHLLETNPSAQADRFAAEQLERLHQPGRWNIPRSESNG